VGQTISHFFKKKQSFLTSSNITTGSSGNKSKIEILLSLNPACWQAHKELDDRCLDYINKYILQKSLEQETTTGATRCFLLEPRWQVGFHLKFESIARLCQAHFGHHGLQGCNGLCVVFSGLIDQFPRGLFIPWDML